MSLTEEKAKIADSLKFTVKKAGETFHTARGTKMYHGQADNVDLETAASLWRKSRFTSQGIIIVDKCTAKCHRVFADSLEAAIEAAQEFGVVEEVILNYDEGPFCHIAVKEAA